MKWLAIPPPRKDPIKNQYINRFGTKKYQILPPQLAKFCPGYKLLINETEYGRNYFTGTSSTDKEYSVDNLKAINNKNISKN